MLSTVDPAWAEENAKAEQAYKKRELKREIASLAIKIQHVDERLARKGTRKVVSHKGKKTISENNQRRGNRRLPRPTDPRKTKAATNKKDTDWGTMYRRKRSLALDSKERLAALEKAMEERRTKNRGNLQRILVNKALEQEGGIKKLFELIDVDGSGQISLKEWRMGLNRLTYQSKKLRSQAIGLKMVADDLFREIDASGDNLLSLDELKTYLEESVKFVPPPQRVKTWVAQTKVSARAAKMTLKDRDFYKQRAHKAEAALMKSGSLDWWTLGDAVLDDHGGHANFAHEKKNSEVSLERSRAYLHAFNANATSQAITNMRPDNFGIVAVSTSRSCASQRPASARMHSTQKSSSARPINRSSARPTSANVSMRTVPIAEVLKRFEQEKSTKTARTRATEARIASMNLSDSAGLFQPFAFYGRWNGFNQVVNG
jgi:Ca2+-binding EF-hand superfamily protein